MDRRSFLTTGLALLAAPAIVRVSSLMPVKTIDDDLYVYGLQVEDQRTNLIDGFSGFDNSHWHVGWWEKRGSTGAWERISKIVPAGKPIEVFS